jgi:peptidoglycan/xylan/chitin deacetylase (PgdA/CDA1 family)
MFKLISRTILIIIAGLSILVPSLSAEKSKVMYQDQVAVIMYHHIDDYAKSSGTITTQLFKNQLSYLKSKGYQFITLKEFKQFMEGASVPSNAVLVTFDDGYKSFYDNAYPILKSMHIPAVNFVITGDLENPLATNVPSMSREQIVEMTHDTNFIDAQCHSDRLHQRLPDGNAALIGRLMTNGEPETEEQYKQRVVADTQACMAKLRELYPGPVDSYAYPYGIYDTASKNYLHQAGIKYAFTIVPEMATRQIDPMQIPRINAGNSAITPEGLHNSILRRVVAVKHPVRDVKLAAVMQQLGGIATMDKENNVVIQYQNKTWTGKINSQQMMSGNEIIRLQKPLLLKNKRVIIGFEDLQNVLGVQLVYNPNVRIFSVRQTPVVKTE